MKRFLYDILADKWLNKNGSIKIYSDPHFGSIQCYRMRHLVNIPDKKDYLNKFKDSDILKAMAMHLDEDSLVYGANGHYAVGGYYDITKVSSVFGDKDYNSQSNIDDASGTTASELYRTNNNELPENLQKAVWLKEY